MKTYYPVKHRLEFIESMKVLITHYKLAIKQDISKSEAVGRIDAPCLLCEPIGLNVCRETVDISYDLRKAFGSFTAGCITLGCPWMVLTGFHCSEDKHLVTGGYIYQTTNKTAQQKRIEQLKEWIKIYEGLEGN